MPNIGPSFSSELNAAGIGGVAISWVEGEDSSKIEGRDRLNPAQLTKLDAVIAAHNPAKPMPPGAYSDAQKQVFVLIDALQAEGILTAARATNIKRRLGFINGP
jgi:hypothetical protein